MDVQRSKDELIPLNICDTIIISVTINADNDYHPMATDVTPHFRGLPPYLPYCSIKCSLIQSVAIFDVSQSGFCEDKRAPEVPQDTLIIFVIHQHHFSLTNYTW